MPPTPSGSIRTGTFIEPPGSIENPASICGTRHAQLVAQPVTLTASLPSLTSSRSTTFGGAQSETTPASTFSGTIRTFREGSGWLGPRDTPIGAVPDAPSGAAPAASSSKAGDHFCQLR